MDWSLIGGVPSDAQREPLATRIDLPLILLAGFTMAIGRYL